MENIIIDGIEYRYFDHVFALSKDGRAIRGLKPHAPKGRSDGYMSIGKNLLHRMVATVWCEKPPGANHVHHINHTKHDNRAENLEWVTPKIHIGEKHPGTGKHVVTDAVKQKLRELRTGSVTSEATKQKQREASIRLGIRPPPRAVGTKVSPAAIAKMIDNSPNAAACEVFGVAYRSYSEASRAIGAKPHTIRKRCLSPNFPDYKTRSESV